MCSIFSVLGKQMNFKLREQSGSNWASLIVLVTGSETRQKKILFTFVWMKVSKQLYLAALQNQFNKLYKNKVLFSYPHTGTFSDGQQSIRCEGTEQLGEPDFKHRVYSLRFPSDLKS